MNILSFMRVAFCASLCLLATHHLNAQYNDQQKLTQLNTLLGGNAAPTDGMSFITPYLLDSVIRTYQKTLSGSQVEAGKLIGTSLSVTDKGATANIGIKRYKGIYPQVTISGQGKDNFISLFKDGQYGNTISTGVQLQIFSNSSGFFSEQNANMLNNRLLILQSTNSAYQSAPPASTPPTTAYDARLTFLYTQIQALVNGHLDYTTAQTSITSLNATQRQNVEQYANAADTLVKLDLLSERFLKYTAATRLVEITTLNGRWSTACEGPGPDERRLRYYLADAEAMQMKAPWNTLTFHWVTVGVNYNVTPYKIFDATAVKENYGKTRNDYFFAVTGAYNHLRARQQGSQFRFFMSPTLTIKNARVFDDDEKITILRNAPTVVGTDSLTFQDMTSEVYKDWKDRTFAATFEFPLIFYWNKQNIGFEISPKVAVNDPKKDNVGLRFGIFIPTEIKDGVPILVQPMFKLQKLFAGGDASFWKDNVVVGFNVSVTMPKGLGKIGS